MYLKKIEIHGFKSFAKKTALEFDRGIISIVGPNGSGKSNFADAIRWVLGEQSMKAVRSKKGEDVIFAGSDTKSRLGMAEVSITFDNEDRTLPIDYSEVVIARRLFRDGESEYLLNAQVVRLMDIVELLAKSGYGNYSYHVISQGTIDQLVIAGPVAIKNLIEEAVGVKPYYLKRDRSLRKLERTSADLLRVKDLVTEIEPRLKSLRRQARRLEQREQTAAELRTLQIDFFAHRLRHLSAERAARDRVVEESNHRARGLQREIETLTEAIAQFESQALKKSRAYTRLQEELQATESKKNGVQEQLAIIRGQLTSPAPATGADQGARELRGRDIASKLQMLARQMEQLQARIVLGEKNFTQHRAIANRLSGDIEALTKSIVVAQQPFDLGKLIADVEKLYSRYQSLLYTLRAATSPEDMRLLLEDAGNLEIIVVKLKDHLARWSSFQLNHSQIGHLTERLQKLFAQKERVSEEIATIQAELSSLKAQLKFLNQQSEELRSQQQRLETEAQSVSPSIPAAHATLLRQEAALREQLQNYFATIQKLEADIQARITAEATEKKELLQQERHLRLLQDQLSKLKDSQGLALIERARLDATLDNLYGEIRAALGNEFIEKIKHHTPPAGEAGHEHKIAKLKAQLELIGGVDELAMQEYRETEERYNYLTTQSKDLKVASDDLQAVIAELDGIIKKQFHNGFEKINTHFSEYFRILFGGGRAGMSLVKPPPPAAETVGEEEAEEGKSENRDEATGAVAGIDIKATPPGKKLTLLSALSGGERTMTAIALLMAILTSFPSPFVVLDEVDAALDEANSIRFAKILSKLAHRTQFITITHNRETMRHSGVLYGITMGEDGVSKVLSIKLDRAIEIAA